MSTINLKDFYYWYKQDEFIELPDAVAEELLADQRYHKAHRRRIYRNKAQYSLDTGDGIETEACYINMSPPEIYEYQLMRCALCRALNSLCETQGQRVDSHYILGMSNQSIAQAEGVDEKNVRQAIKRGIQKMREHMKNYF